jgi:membrane protein YdbS with pleckstrin-like domain
MLILDMNTIFSNQQINTTELPTTDAVIFQPLHAKYKRVVLISTIIFLLFLLALGASGFYLPFLGEDSMLLEYKAIVFGASVVFSLLVLVLNMLGVSKKGYAVREHDILYKSGVLHQKETTIPFNRVQHVEIYEGALLRLFGLCRIEFFTAGGSLGDLKIPGLPLEEANKIKAYVIEKVLPQAKERGESNTQDFLNTEQ